MSRTVRKSPDEHDHSYNQESGDCDYVRNLDGRDRKDGNKPAGWWKRYRRQSRRNKENQAMRNRKFDSIPTFKKNDVWEWN